jgi:Xaa-Pro aminopeptidase
MSKFNLFSIYQNRLQTLNFDSARQSSIEALRTERGSPSPSGKGDEEVRLSELAASQNSKFGADSGIVCIKLRAFFQERQKMADYRARLDRARNELDKSQLDALLVSDSINLFYLTGLELSAGDLLIDREKAFLFADGRYIEAVKNCPHVEAIASAECSLIQFLENRPDIRTISIDEKSSYKIVSDLQKELETKGKKLAPGPSLIDKLRIIKDSEELAKLEKAAELCCRGYDYVCQSLKEGISEKELADKLEIFWKESGADGLAFSSIIAFGENGSMPHYRSGEIRLKKNQAILIDIGVKLDRYCSDMTRMAYFGEPPKEIAKIHAIVAHAQKLALDLCKPGVKIGALDEAARGYITSCGFGERFTHRLGHGVGLEIHEAPSLRNQPPFSDIVLEEGMVITIEPGIYLPNIGGVRLENTIAITKEGYKNFIPRQGLLTRKI